MKKSLLFIVCIFTLLLNSNYVSAELAGDIDPDGDNSCVEIKRDLRYRATDAQTSGEVSVLQDYLQANGFLSANPTGYFGLLTKAGVTKFQKDNLILATGFVGPITRAKIKTVSCDSTTTPVTPSTEPTLTLTSQKTNESWYIGTSHTVSWNYSNLEGNITVALFNPSNANTCVLGDYALKNNKVDITLPLWFTCQNNNKELPSGTYQIMAYVPVRNSTSYYNINANGLGTITINRKTDSVPSQPIVQIPSTIQFNRNLEVGSKGTDVLALQIYLKNKGFLQQNFADLGNFDETTKNALIAFQVSQGISPADGTAGPMTRAILMAQNVTTTTPTIPPTVTTPAMPVNSQYIHLPVHYINITAGSQDVSLERINLQVDMQDEQGNHINPANIIRGIAISTMAKQVLEVPVNETSFTKDSTGKYYIQLNQIHFTISKNTEEKLTVFVDAIASKQKTQATFSIYGSTGIRTEIIGTGVSIYNGGSLEVGKVIFNTKETTKSLATGIATISFVGQPIQTPTTPVQPPVVTIPPVAPTIPIPPNTSCPQSITIAGITYTLPTCPVEYTMTDGAGNKNFDIIVTSSGATTTRGYGFSVYGYGEGLPTYGSLGTASGGAQDGVLTKIQRYFNDSILSADGDKPKVYTGYFKIHIYQGSATNDNNFLYQNFKLTVNPATTQ